MVTSQRYSRLDVLVSQRRFRSCALIARGDGKIMGCRSGMTRWHATGRALRYALDHAVSVSVEYIDRNGKRMPANTVRHR